MLSPSESVTARRIFYLITCSLSEREIRDRSLELLLDIFLEGSANDIILGNLASTYLTFGKKSVLNCLLNLYPYLLVSSRCWR